MTATETNAPHFDRPLSEAINLLTGAEVEAIEDHYRKPLSELASAWPMRLTLGVIWAFRRRTERGIDWATVKAMTLTEQGQYFAPEPDDDDGGFGAAVDGVEPPKG